MQRLFVILFISLPNIDCVCLLDINNDCVGAGTLYYLDLIM